jgi:hypothetical protein
MTTKEEQPQKITKSSQWRIVFSNIAGIQFSDEFRLHVGFDQDRARPGTDVLEEALIVMSPRSAKFLSHTLSAAISKYEEINGPITGLDEMIKQADAALSRTSTSAKSK